MLQSLMVSTINILDSNNNLLTKHSYGARQNKNESYLFFFVMISNFCCNNSFCAKNDSRIYEEVLQKLKKRHLRKNHVIYFDKEYYSIENYLIGINECNIALVIFPRQYFSIEKLEAKMSTRLDIFYYEKKLKQEN